MKRIFLYLFIVITHTNLKSQENVIDSLENVINNHISNDTSKVNLLNELSHKYASFDLEKSQEKAEKANDLSKKLKYKKGEARSLIRFGHIHRLKSELEEAEEDALNALKLYEEINDKAGIINSKISLGNTANYNSDLEKALKYYTEVFNISIIDNDLYRQASMLSNIGTTYYSKGNLDTALSIYKKSFVLSEKIGEKKLNLRAANNIGAIYLNQGRYLEALDYFNKCLLTHKEENNKQEIAISSYNISAVYYELKQYDKTLMYLEESLNLYKEINQKLKTAGCLINIGAVYSDLKEFPKALDFMTKALAISAEINDKSELSAIYFQLGGLRLLMQQPKIALKSYITSLEISKEIGSKIYICHSSIGLAQTYVELKEYTKALHYALEGEKIANDLDLLVQQKLASEILSTIYSKTNNYKKAFESHQQYKILNDSIFNRENIEKITQLEYEYKYKQELELANFRELKLTETVKETEFSLQKSQRNLLLGVIAFLIIGIILGTIIFFLRLRNAKSEAKNVLIEQKLLRSQMTPHFIFNALSVLQGMILNKEDEKAVSYLSKFSKLLRVILENSREKTVSLEQELTAVETYLKLQNIEEKLPYIYTILVNETIDKTQFKIPPMLIQPFIENAIEHAFRNQKENRKIDIHLNYLDKKLICTIKDNGIGIDTFIENKKQYKKSLATTITSERLKMLSKDFKMKGAVHVEDRQKHYEKGTIVTLVIPYKTNAI